MTRCCASRSKRRGAISLKRSATPSLPRSPPPPPPRPRPRPPPPPPPLPRNPPPRMGRGRALAPARALLGGAGGGRVPPPGPGGTGKTRLALQAAADLLDEFADGVYFVNLAPITDPALVVPAIAGVL